MRLELIIPDTTRPDLKAKLRSLVSRLSAQPELVDEIHLGEGEDQAIQKLFTPELLAEIDAAAKEMRTDGGVSMDNLRSSLAETRAQWHSANTG